MSLVSFTIILHLYYDTQKCVVRQWNIVFQSTVDVYSASREEPKESAGPYSHLVSKNTSIKRQTPVALLPQSGHVVRAIPAHHAPKEVHPLGMSEKIIWFHFDFEGSLDGPWDPVCEVFQA